PSRCRRRARRSPGCRSARRSSRSGDGPGTCRAARARATSARSRDRCRGRRAAPRPLHDLIALEAEQLAAAVAEQRPRDTEALHHAGEVAHAIVAGLHVRLEPVEEQDVVAELAKPEQILQKDPCVPAHARPRRERARDDYRLAHGPRRAVDPLSAPSLIVSGMIAATPRQGGATWAVLQYLLGFRRLGASVYFVEPVDEPDPDSAAYCGEVMGAFGLEGRWALVPRDGGDPIGM